MDDLEKAYSSFEQALEHATLRDDQRAMEGIMEALKEINEQLAIKAREGRQSGAASGDKEAEAPVPATAAPPQMSSDATQTSFDSITVDPPKQPVIEEKEEPKEEPKEAPKEEAKTDAEAVANKEPE